MKKTVKKAMLFSFLLATAITPLYAVSPAAEIGSAADALVDLSDKCVVFEFRATCDDTNADQEVWDALSELFDATQDPRLDVIGLAALIEEIARLCPEDSSVGGTVEMTIMSKEEAHQLATRSQKDDTTLYVYRVFDDAQTTLKKLAALAQLNQ